MTAPFAAALLAGSRRTGTALGHGYVQIGDDVLAVTPPGAPRMPNGIEGELELEPGETVTVGGGELRAAAGSLATGELWDPRPRPRVSLSLSPEPSVDLPALAGRGPGLTPLGDDVLVGWIAAAALAGEDASELAEDAGGRTTALSRTLLRLAARGELPEPAHRLLEHGELEPLLRFGASSGRGIAFGLALHGT
jgi:hypothetical protein